MAGGHTPEQMVQEERRYIQIFFWLAVLTALEIGVIYTGIAPLAIRLILVVLAGTKAALVALFYMHLAFEKRTLTYIALTPAVLCVFLVFMLLPDLGAVTRALTHAVAAATAGAHH